MIVVYDSMKQLSRKVTDKMEKLMHSVRIKMKMFPPNLGKECLDLLDTSINISTYITNKNVCDSYLLLLSV